MNNLIGFLQVFGIGLLSSAVWFLYSFLLRAILIKYDWDWEDFHLVPFSIMNLLTHGAIFGAGVGVCLAIEQLSK